MADLDTISTQLDELTKKVNTLATVTLNGFDNLIGVASDILGNTSAISKGQVETNSTILAAAQSVTNAITTTLKAHAGVVAESGDAARFIVDSGLKQETPTDVPPTDPVIPDE